MEFLVGCSNEVEGASAPSRGPRIKGLQTPDTGTPPPRSLSPSSDGGRSPSERSAPTASSGSSANVTPTARKETSEGRQKAGRRTKAHGGFENVATGEGSWTAYEADQTVCMPAYAAAVMIPVGCVVPLPMPMPPPVPHADAITDERIIRAIAADRDVHARLLHTAKMVPEILQSGTAGPSLSSNVELYGSMSLDMTDARTEGEKGRQDWSSYYINGQSDVDYVVQVGSGVTPSMIAERLKSKGHWTVVSSTTVHKFSSTQYTLHGSFDDDKDSEKVYLDITCIESSLHYSRFQQRQEAFRRVFTDARNHLEGLYGASGALAFDAYIHCLKAFARKLPGTTLTGFQATCIGIFTLQISHYRFRPNQPMALSFFEGFLRFCRYFFGEQPMYGAGEAWSYHHYHSGLDIGEGGRWTSRINLCWESELYLLNAEVKMKTRPEERVNVLHSLQPARVAAEAHEVLNRNFNDLPCQLFAAPPVVPVMAGPPMP